MIEKAVAENKSFPRKPLFHRQPTKSAHPHGGYTHARQHRSPIWIWLFHHYLLLGLGSAMCLVAVLSCVLVGQTQSSPESLSFFMGHLRYSHNDGNDCSGVGRNMAQLVSQVSTVPIRDEQKVSLTDPQLFQIPFLFMNGHNNFQFDAAELANLRAYLEHGGFLFASGCCTNPEFPRAWRRELNRVFPGHSVQPLPYDHPIYHTFYNISSMRNLHQNRPIYLEGLIYRGRVVAVICEEGLCCAFSMDNRCNVFRCQSGRRQETGTQYRGLRHDTLIMTH